MDQQKSNKAERVGEEKYKFNTEVLPKNFKNGLSRGSY
jgi:hypothetical protein